MIIEKFWLSANAIVMPVSSPYLLFKIMKAFKVFCGLFIGQGIECQPTDFCFKL